MSKTWVPASEIQIGDRVQLGCKWVTVGRVELQTRGPLKGQIALGALHDWMHFFQPGDLVPVIAA